MLTSGEAVGKHLAFGDFELAPAARALWRSGVPVKLGSRALDILIALASRPGEILSKEELTRLVWRGAKVDETALRVGISAVRKALGEDGDRYVTTVAGRGYCFALEVAATVARPSPEAADRRPFKPQRLPHQIVRVVGRDAVIEVLVREVARRRLLSVVGPGGIGKTTVALAVATRLRGAFDAIAFVDLAPIEDGRQMWAGVAAALGLNLLLQHDPVEELAAAVAQERVLLVFDNCEHLIDLVATFVEDLLEHAPGVSVLATTRELLRAAGEWVHQLPPLEAPPEAAALSAEQARTYSAVELFEERADFALGGYRISDTDAFHVAEICRRLDGVALAIELAAGRLAELGVQGLANSLEDCFSILTHGRRTAFPRHQTLRATLDWSYRLLSLEDQAALRRLSVFNGVFTLEDADFVMGASTNTGEAADRLTSLVEKSLVAARPEEGRPQYRLLETTRAYGQDKLEESGEADPPRYRHAQRFLDVCRASVVVGHDQSFLRRATADIRAALDWCLVRGGDPSLGIDLAAAAAPVFLSLSLLREHRKYLDLALDHLSACVDTISLGEATLRSEMALRMAIVLADYYASPQEAVPEAQLQRAADIAQSLGDKASELKALWMLYGWAGNVGSYRQALLYARSYVAAAAGATDPTVESRCNRMLALGLTHLGQHSAAQTHIEQALRSIRTAIPRAARHAYDADDSIAARAIYARILWLRGRPDDAKAEAEQCIAEALQVGQDQSICWAIVFNICPVAIWRGDLDLAETLVSLLLERSKRSFEHYHDWGLLYRQSLGGGTSAPGYADSICRSDVRFKLPAQADLFATFDAEFVGADSLARAQADEDIWCAPELLRASAHRLLLSDGENAFGAAEAALLRSLEIAKRRDAKAWALRAATSLASLYVRSSRSCEARALLQPMLKEFRQGHDSRDFQTATRVLSEAF